MSAFPPPTHALVLGGKVVIAVLIPVLAVSLLVGGQGIDPAYMGFLAVAVLPYCTPKQSVVFLLLFAATGVVATMASMTVWAVVVIVAVCLAAGLASRISAGTFGIAAVAASVMSLSPSENPPWVVGAVMLGVGAYVAVIIHLMKFHVSPKPATWEVAARHAGVQALACGLATAVALYYDWPQPYWIVMTLALVLKPYRGESLARSRQRILGTVLGALIAVLLSPLPRPWQLVMAAVCMALMLAYTVAKDYVLKVTFLTPMVIFLVSSGTVTDTLRLDGLRVLYTVCACVVGGLLALGLARTDDKVPA